MKNPNGRPNFFHYAYTEAPQDGIICWLIDWAGQDVDSEKDRILRDCGRKFVRALLCKHCVDLPEDKIDKTEVFQQDNHIDVLARINDEHVLLIEDKIVLDDKTGSERNDETLRGYYSNVTGGKTQLEGVDKDKIYPIYLQTGNQPLYNDRHIEKIDTGGKPYKVFNRAEFLEVLKSCKGDNPILMDFRNNLQKYENCSNSYTEWTQYDKKDCWRAWEGLYRCLERKLLDGRDLWVGWGYVPRSSFLGFWWSPFSEDISLYLQIETHPGKPGKKTKLCFKVDAEGKTSEQQEQLKGQWHERVMDADKQQVVSPRMMRRGKWMTVGWWKEDWLAFGADYKLYIDGIIKNLKYAEEVLKRAADSGGSPGSIPPFLPDTQL